ncbi:MAG: hypothetical protein ACOCQL_06895 [Halolamina sp.]
MDRRGALLGVVIASLLATGVVLAELPTPVTLAGLAGPVLAGAVSRPERYDGAVEGAVAGGGAVPLTMLVVAGSRLQTFQGTDTPFQLLWLTGGPQAISGVFVVFPLALAAGAVAGWLGRFARDLGSGGVSIAES